MAKYYLTALIISSLMTSCIGFKPEKNDFNCPPKEQACYPLKWKGLPVDTSADYREVADWYYIFEPVKHINSPSDEWCLSFLTKQNAIMTYTDENIQKVIMLRLPKENEGSIESGLGISFSGSIGALSVKGESVALAASSDSKSVLTGNSDIYTAKILGNRLFDLKKSDGRINGDYTSWESQPAFSPNANVIFFISDRNADLRGTDVYFTYKQQDGSWSDAVNCGDNINTRCDELTPFVDSSGKTLYFASSGHETLGGYDIFSSRISDSYWEDLRNGKFSSEKLNDYFSPAENLRSPLNTAADELFPSSPVNCNELLYYCSNQAANEPGNLILRRGGFDIYVRRKVDKTKFKKIESTKILADEIEIKDIKPDLNTKSINLTYLLEGMVYNANDRTPLPGSEIDIKELQGEVVKNPENTVSDRAGKFNAILEKDIDYEITAHASRYFFDSQRLRVNLEDTVTLVKKDFYIPISMILRINFPTDIYDKPYKFTLDSNCIETSRTWQEELDLLAYNILASKDKILKVQLVGHTDDVASDEYNIHLGKRRVDFVISELIKRGVSKEFLEGRSAGENEPLQRRDNEELEIYRKRLRRVELQKILK